MEIRDVMKKDVETIVPHSTVKQAAEKIMRDKNGLLPVTKNKQIVGVISEKDISLRAAGKDFEPQKIKVKELMSENVLVCSENAPALGVGRQMIARRVNDLCVLNAENQLVGVVSLFALAGAINTAAFWKSALSTLSESR